MLFFLGFGVRPWVHDIVWMAIVEPMELGHLPYRKRVSRITLAPWIEEHGKKNGNARWPDVVKRLIAALEHDEVVPGRRNVKTLDALPAGQSRRR